MEWPQSTGAARRQSCGLYSLIQRITGLSSRRYSLLSRALMLFLLAGYREGISLPVVLILTEPWLLILPLGAWLLHVSKRPSGGACSVHSRCSLPEKAALGARPRARLAVTLVTRILLAATRVAGARKAVQMSRGDRFPRRGLSPAWYTAPAADCDRGSCTGASTDTAAAARSQHQASRPAPG